MPHMSLSLAPSRRSFLVTLGVFALTAVAPKAYAGEEWCGDDPPVTLLVHGKPVTVNTYFSVPIRYRRDLAQASVTGVAQGNTITISATLPGTVFRVYSEIPSLGRSAGRREEVHPAGKVVTLRFTGLTAAWIDGIAGRPASFAT